jgi:hypothetical protein
MLSAAKHQVAKKEELIAQYVFADWPFASLKMDAIVTVLNLVGRRSRDYTLLRN